MPRVLPSTDSLLSTPEADADLNMQAQSASAKDSQRGATSLEWTLLVAAIALPGYFILNSALNLLIAYYQMMTELNSLPFP